MCDRNKQQCDEKRDHKDMGMHQDLGELNKVFNKDGVPKDDISKMRGDIQGKGGCESGQKCDMGQKKKMGCGKNEQCH
ncbi:unnamed protein product [Caenorhabditis brenneri]